MVKLLLLSLGAVALLAMPALAQTKLRVTAGSVAFTSNAQLELIKASTSDVQGLLDPATNQFAFIVDIKSFQGFNSALQREHFNEKYLESERFPKARFSGKIIEQVDFSVDGTYEVRAKGELDIHGVKQIRIIRSKLTVAGNVIRIQSSFTVPLADHDVTIPSIVSQKIATEIDVEFVAQLVPQ